ncbi:hypothetical protein [Polymorphospora lycopeni]|uniref:Type I restriction modification DNA specificity domain-containing protein n=1 Tax=Polymorphospora lycopeni TaxID=3140240 RepID=A0ABV5CJU5_9ACTN
MNSTKLPWVTAAPSHWRRGRLKDMINSSANGVWGDDPLGDGTDVFCVRAADFDRTRQRVSKERLPHRSIDDATLTRHMLRPGDLILEKSGGGEKQPVGLAVIFDLSEPAVCSNFCSRLTPAHTIDPRFLSYSFAAAYNQGLTQSAIKQTTGIQNLDTGALFSSPWAYPGIEEQRQLADFLDAETSRIDQLINLQRQVVAGIEERDTAILDAELDLLLDEAGTLPFRRYVVGVEQGSSPQCEAVPATEEEWGVLRVSCLRPGQFFPGENKRLPADSIPDARHEVQQGDLLITRANTPQLVGATAVVPSTRRKLLLSDKIFRVDILPTLDPHYVATIARGSRIRNLCSAVSNGASQSMANIRFEEVKEWPIPTINLDRQRDLVSRMGRAWEITRDLRAKVQSQLSLLTERKRALITATVTGQIDVSSASGRGIEG